MQELLNVTAARALPSQMKGPLIPYRGTAFGFMQCGPSLPLVDSGDLFPGGRGHIPAEGTEERPEERLSIILIETFGEGFDYPLRG